MNNANNRTIKKMAQDRAKCAYTFKSIISDSVSH